MSAPPASSYSSSSSASSPAVMSPTSILPAPTHIKIQGKRASCLIIYTGGTIGMKRTKDGSLAPSSGYLLTTLRAMPELSHEDVPSFDVLEWPEPMDSSDFSPDCWVTLASQISEHYFSYDGFVILHGTDTMAYTASALSFMLEHLAKTVIITGSMIPLAAPVSDARRNLIISLMCSVNLDVPEVCVYFHNLLLRGNRCKKLDPANVHAFDSPNYPPLAQMGVRITLDRELVRPAPRRRFVAHLELYRRIAVMMMTPAFDDAAITSYVSTSTRDEPVVLVLQLYGAGNAPTHKPSFVAALQHAAKQHALIVVLTQCVRGGVDRSQYQSGMALGDSVIDGRDMTVEACVTKIAHLMGRGVRQAAHFKHAMESNLRGELTLITGHEYAASPATPYQYQNHQHNPHTPTLTQPVPGLHLHAAATSAADSSLSFSSHTASAITTALSIAPAADTPSAARPVSKL